MPRRVVRRLVARCGGGGRLWGWGTGVDAATRAGVDGTPERGERGRGGRVIRLPRARGVLRCSPRGTLSRRERRLASRGVRASHRPAGTLRAARQSGVLAAHSYATVAARSWVLRNTRECSDSPHRHIPIWQVGTRR